jgi:hypothetical protein
VKYQVEAASSFPCSRTMVSQPHFQLFPSTVTRPQGSSHRKLSKQPKKQEPPSPIALDEITQPKETESVLIRIIEDINNNDVGPPPQEHRALSNSRVASPEHVVAPHGERSTSALSERQETNSTGPPTKTDIPAANSTNNRSNNASTKPKLSPLSTSSRTISPIVAMRSMFPRYNPNVPLDRQEYFPRNGQSHGLPSPPPLPHAEPACPPAEVDAILGPRTVPPDVVQFPSDTFVSAPIQYSEPTELQSFWDAANGQKLTNSLGTFNLRLER